MKGFSLKIWPLITAAIVASVIGYLVCFLWLAIPVTLDSTLSIWLYGLIGTITIGLLIAAFTPGDFEDHWGRTVILSVILIVLLVIIGVGSTSCFHAGAYASRISIDEATEFKETDLPAFDPEQLPWVSEEQAQVLGDKKLGELGSIGSSSHMGEYVRQVVNGKLYYVSPIEHNGFFEYNSNPSGTPGYVMVSMTNDSDVQLITKVGDSSIAMRYQPNAAWGDKLSRHALLAYPNLAIEEWKFEIDEDLNPYWIGAYYHKTIGIAAPDIGGVLVVNAQTGKIDRYTVDEVPAWIDRVYPTSYIEEQINDWGTYQDGWWNSRLGKSNLTNLTEGNTVVFKDGQCYMFSGLTASGNTDASTVGFVLTNYRTKATVYYHRTGATELAAMGVAEGDDRVRPSGYIAEFPVPVMLEGEPTYFFGLRDPYSNVNKMFALVNIEQHQIVGVGSTINAAKLDYLTKLRTYKGGALNTPTADLVEIEGNILRIGSYSEGGNTFYKFIIDSAPDKICVTDSTFLEISITNAGDRVKVRVMETPDSVWSVFSFDNLEFTQTTSELEDSVSQTELERRLQEIEEDPNVMSDEEFLSFFQTLTPAQQEKFLADLEGLKE